MNRVPPTDLQALLVADEGEVLHVYLDSRGVQTLGVGRRVDGKGGISRLESRYLLANDIIDKRVAAAKYSWFPLLSPARQAVILSMLFVFGEAGFAGWADFIRFVEKGAWMAAGQDLLNSLWHKEAPERVARLALQIELDAWQ